VTILDASAIINLINGGVLDVILSLPGYKFAVGPQALDECTQQRSAILTLTSIVFLSDDDIPASLFFALLDQYQLGLGETECLALASRHGGEVCTDDRKARKMCAKVLGPERVFGSARLLREAVAAKVLSAEGAIGAYQAMRVAGAFLPEIPDAYFSEEKL